MAAGRSLLLLLHLLISFHERSLCCTADETGWSSTRDVELDTCLERLYKPAAKSIKSEDGDIIDCVNIYNQPAFDHPLLSNHTIQMEPSSFPDWLRPQEVSSAEFSQVWHRAVRCPDGTIPIRRILKSSALQAKPSSFRSFSKRYPRRSTALNFSASSAADQHGHEHAIAYMDTAKYYGATASINVWNPELQFSDDFSLGQIWVISHRDGITQTVEAGWIVSPDLLGDSRTRLFIYWTADSYQNTGCFNLLCPAFVQVNQEIVLGGTMAPVSTYNGKQFYISIYIFKDQSSGNWWLKVQNKILGYWPSFLFDGLADSANVIEWGGEIFDSGEAGRHTSTQMGSGHFPNEGFGKASYFANLGFVDGSHNLREPHSLGRFVEAPSCYDVKISKKRHPVFGRYFFYGGPGLSPSCS